MEFNFVKKEIPCESLAHNFKEPDAYLYIDSIKCTCGEFTASVIKKDEDLISLNIKDNKNADQ